MDKDTTKTTFIQLFETVFTKDFFTAISEKGADRYTKKLFAKPFIQMLTYAVIQNLDGLRDISESLANPILSQALQLESISHSQIARRLSKFPTEILQSLFISNATNPPFTLGLRVKGDKRARLTSFPRQKGGEKHETIFFSDHNRKSV